MPAVVKFFFWSFPLNTMIDALIQLPVIHTKDIAIDIICKQLHPNETHCDYDKLCELNPEWCRK